MPGDAGGGMELLDLACEVETSFVRVRSLTKVYETKGEPLLALDTIDYEQSRREFVSIVGPSGCGKSTFLMLLAGLVRPTAGDIQIDGGRVRGPYTQLSIIFQQDNLLEWRTVLANVLLPIEIRHLRTSSYRARALQLLKLVGLNGFEEMYPAQLSGGMRQRAALCRALVYEAPLLLMDEPFGALDALTRDQLNVDFQRIWLGSGQTVLFVTHSISEAVFLSDRVLVMTPRPGRIRASLSIDLPRPRRLAVRETPEFNAYVREIRQYFQEMQIIREEEL